MERQPTSDEIRALGLPSVDKVLKEGDKKLSTLIIEPVCTCLASLMTPSIASEPGNL